MCVGCLVAWRAIFRQTWRWLISKGPSHSATLLPTTSTRTFTSIRHFQSPRIIEGFRYAGDTDAFPSPIGTQVASVDLGQIWVIGERQRVCLVPQTLACSDKEISLSRWKGTLLIATLISGGFSFVQVVLQLWSRSRRAQNVLKPSEVLSEDRAEQVMVGRLKRYSKRHGGLLIFAFKITRFLCCLALFSLSLLSIIRGCKRHKTRKWRRRALMPIHEQR